MPAGVVPRDIVAITPHNTNPVTDNLIAIQATVGGILSITNHAGVNISVPIGDNQIIPLFLKGLIIRVTGTTATGLIGFK